MRFRVASVSFLNAVPLVAGLHERSAGVALTSALPSRLAGLLADGEADVALLPVVEALRGNCAGIVPDAVIACRGAVASVKLFASGPLERLEQVQVDRGSRTSVALLEILLREATGRCPELVVAEPDASRMPGPERGALVIGDRCFAFDRALKDAAAGSVRAHDLGAMWLELTGLPFVFAAWSLRPRFLEERGAAALEALRGILNSSRDLGLDRIPVLAAEAAAAGKLGTGGEANADAIAYYFAHNLRYRLGDQEEAGLRRFHELCQRHGLVASGNPLTLLKG